MWHNADQRSRVTYMFLSAWIDHAFGFTPLPFYAASLAMLGTAPNPRLQAGDLALQTLARQLGKEQHFAPTPVAVLMRLTATPGMTPLLSSVTDPCTRAR